KMAPAPREKGSGLPRLGSTTPFYLRAALRYLGRDPEKDMTILQLGGGGEIVTAMQSGRVAAAALPFRNTFPLMQWGWPVLVDLSSPSFTYPSSCVATSRTFIKTNAIVVERFLKAYIEATRLITKDPALVERVIKNGTAKPTQLLSKRVLKSAPLSLSPFLMFPTKVWKWC